MILKVIDIGNSKGIRLPQALIKNYSIEKEIKVELNEDGIFLKPIRNVREGWEEKFKSATGVQSNDEKSWQEPTNKFEEEEWQW